MCIKPGVWPVKRGGGKERKFGTRSGSLSVGVVAEHPAGYTEKTIFLWIGHIAIVFAMADLNRLQAVWGYSRKTPSKKFAVKRHKGLELVDPFVVKACAGELAGNGRLWVANMTIFWVPLGAIKKSEAVRRGGPATHDIPDDIACSPDVLRPVIAVPTRTLNGPGSVGWRHVRMCHRRTREQSAPEVNT